jgi:DNA-directed RNA polymerase subunit RPC12/RpoP
MSRLQALGPIYMPEPRTSRTPRTSPGQGHCVGQKNRAQAAHTGQANRAQPGGGHRVCARFPCAACAVTPEPPAGSRHLAPVLTSALTAACAVCAVCAVSRRYLPQEKFVSDPLRHLPRTDERSNQANPPRSTIDDLIEATADGRAVIRELHGATKDLRQLIVQARQIPQAVMDDLGARIAESAESAHRDMDAHAAALTLKLTEGLPLNILCSKCGAVLAEIDLTGIPLTCGSCGHKFMIRDNPESPR